MASVDLPAQQEQQRRDEQQPQAGFSAAFGAAIGTPEPSQRSGGIIVVRGECSPDGHLLVEVEDNGIGMTTETLEMLRAQLDSSEDQTIIAENGFGINNVNQRIKLYYGQEYGLTIDSEHQNGTRVSLIIPLEKSPPLSRI